MPKQSDIVIYLETLEPRIMGWPIRKIRLAPAPFFSDPSSRSWLRPMAGWWLGFAGWTSGLCSSWTVSLSQAEFDFPHGTLVVTEVAKKKRGIARGEGCEGTRPQVNTEHPVIIASKTRPAASHTSTPLLATTHL